MKKILLSAAFVTSSLLSFAQNQPQIPNSGFETWKTFSKCPNVDSAAHYSTRDEEFYAGVKKCPTTPSISKTTNSHSGTYALKMTTFAVAGPISTIYTGGYASLADTLFGSAILFTGRPIKLKGYYNLSAAGTDIFTVNVGTFRSNSDDLVSSGEFKASTSTTGYQSFEIVLEYYETGSVNPDSLFLNFILASNSGFGNQNSFVYIDDLTFEYATPTSVDYSSISPLNVYAANKNINFSETVSDVHVVDMIGASKMQEVTSTKILNAASLHTGMYIVTYKYNDAYFSKKIVIE